MGGVDAIESSDTRMMGTRLTKESRLAISGLAGGKPSIAKRRGQEECRCRVCR